MVDNSSKFNTFKDFYPFYLSEHQNIICRRFHIIGSFLVLLNIIAVVFFIDWYWIFGVPVLGYGFAWSGHFFFEKNKPATFRYPIYSLMGDWVMFGQVLSRKIPF